MTSLHLILLLLTIFMAFLVALVAYDKINDRRMRIQGQGCRKPKSDKERAVEILNALPADVTYEQILTKLRYGWIGDIPEEVRTKLREVFTDDEESQGWLTSRQPAMNYAIPVEILRVPMGGKMILNVLNQQED